MEDYVSDDSPKIWFCYIKVFLKKKILWQESKVKQYFLRKHIFLPNILMCFVQQSMGLLQMSTKLLERKRPLFHIDALLYLRENGFQVLIRFT